MCDRIRWLFPYASHWWYDGFDKVAWHCGAWSSTHALQISYTIEYRSMGSTIEAVCLLHRQHIGDCMACRSLVLHSTKSHLLYSALFRCTPPLIRFMTVGSPCFIQYLQWKGVEVSNSYWCAVKGYVHAPVDKKGTIQAFKGWFCQIWLAPLWFLFQAKSVLVQYVTLHYFMDMKWVCAERL